MRDDQFNGTLQFTGDYTQGGPPMYSLSIYWAIQTLFGVGFGDISNYMKSIPELLLTTFTMLLSQLLMSTMIGYLINLHTNQKNQIEYNVDYLIMKI